MNTKFKTKLLSSLMLIGLFSGTCFSQDNVIHNLTGNSDRFISSDVVVGNRSSQATADLPSDLLYELNATVYVKNNTLSKVKGKAHPLVLKFKDAQSFNVVSKRSALFNTVEMIKIDLASENDLRTPFNMAALRGFNNLKYVYLKCEFPATEAQIRTFIQNADPKLIIYYNTYQRS
ncbi:hypothetical protein ES711_13380 [Gelidibacter salicanalis]|uniref:Uncharacterized protein n=1 Tax=Gelidibacter salicanalis TaxID=291193 RepID=A0A5C7ACH8_9FLAO|nr:hypothetical protein [Gelidibacter salicanalis]TXE06500.1 hypothetical protein ES711_13380 [Gelidibacter salicanalis]